MAGADRSVSSAILYFMVRTLGCLLILPALCWIRLAASDQLLDHIRGAQSSGDFELAASLYRQLIATGEDSAEIRSNYAAMLHLSGHEREAVAQARIALSRNPKLTAPNVIAGTALLQLGQAREALPYLERAHRQDQASIAPLLGLGQGYVAIRDYSRSNAAYFEATKLDPNSAEAWYGLGITYRSLADTLIKKSPMGTIPPEAQRSLEQALQALAKAVAIEPNSSRAHLILAESYRDSGKYLEAIDEYKIALKLSTDNTPAELGLATMYWKANESEDAVPLLKRVLAKLPYDAEANGIMAEILVRRGEFEAATPYAKRALDGNPGLMQVRFALAKIYLAKNQPEPAILELQKAAPADPDGSYHYLLHRALMEAGRDLEAAAALEEFKRRRNASRVPQK